MYLHGYGSAYKPGSEKVIALRNLGKVHGISLDYAVGAQACIDAVIEYAMSEDIDLLVGCSMGGWLSSHAASQLGLPFVALNPAIRPSESLLKYVGTVVNFSGKDCEITRNVVLEYPDIATDGCGLILCQDGDEVIDPKITIKELEPYYKTELVAGGSHRFEHLERHLPAIENLVFNAGIVYGLTND